MRVSILGGGESGVGAALLARTVGDDPFVSDYGQLDPVYRQKLIENNVRFEEGGHTFDILVASDLIIKSPGIPDKASVIQELRSHGLSIISEIEYGFRHSQGKIIAITGSNGKTTTTHLVYHLLKSKGVDAVKGGNLGTSFSSLIQLDKEKVYVLEISSFQLDGIENFRPEVALITNITPDHLDRYDYNFDKYADSKLRISKNQSQDDLLIYLADDEKTVERLKTVKARLHSIDKGEVGSFLTNLENPHLSGLHNELNVAFAVRAVRELVEMTDDEVLDSLSTFVNDRHRLETVCFINGVRWINDSKATNVDAAYYALDTMSSPVIWIAGGIDKGNDYSSLTSLVKQKVKNIICLGKGWENIRSSFEKTGVELDRCESMNEVILRANNIAQKGDVVLLSPACASFDLFKNYEDRGEQFCKAVWDSLRKRK